MAMMATGLTRPPCVLGSVAATSPGRRLRASSLSASTVRRRIRTTTLGSVPAKLCNLIIDAIIKEEIGGKDTELALINNEMASAGTEEYAGYQTWRQKAKTIADEVLGL